MVDSARMRDFPALLDALRAAMRQPLSGLSRSWWYLICALVFFFALALRIAHSRAGLPYIGDDTDTYSFALYMNRRESLDPQMFVYPSLVFMYGFFVNHLGVFLSNLSGGKMDASALNWGLDGWGWNLGNPDLLLLNRLGMGLVGAVLSLVVIAIGVEISGRLAGLIAGLVLAVNSFMIEQETRFTVNGFAAFFCGLSVFCALRYLSRHDGRWIYLSALAAGFAAGSKYTAGVVVLAPVLALLLTTTQKYTKYFWRTLVLSLLSATAAFLVSTPYALISFREFFAGIWGGRSLYFTSEFYGAQVSPGLEHLFGTGTFLRSYWGIAALVLGAVGVVVLLAINTKPWVVTYVPFFAFTGIITASSVNRHGNHLISYPVIAVGVGAGFSFLVAVFLVARKRLGSRSWPFALPAVVAVIPIGLAVSSGFQQGYHDWNFEDPRVRSIDALKQQGTSSGVTIATELRVHPAERERIQGYDFVEVVPLQRILACDFTPDTTLMLPTSVTTWREAAARRIGDSKPPNALNAELQKSLEGLTPSATFGERETVLDYNFENPKVILIEGNEFNCSQ